MNLQKIASHIGQLFEEMDQARDRGIVETRRIIKSCSLAIRAVHREEFQEAEQHLREARERLDQINVSLRCYPEIFYGGFVQDAQKEYAEARITFNVVLGKAIPTPEDVGVDFAPYLNGMAEAVGEMRRHILDQLRKGSLEQSERVLAVMDDIFYMLIGMDYPDAITRGLRRSTDIARSCLEKTRGDLTTHWAGINLEREISGLRRGLNREADQLLEAALRP